jgi:hypothetical protein
MQINQRLDQRAGIGQTSIEPFKETKDRIHFEIVYKNTGKTPALEVTSIASVVEDPNDISINNPIENPEKFVIAPGGEGRATTREYGGIAKAVLSGKSKYVIGTIYYRDIFNVWHTTKFCFKINSNATFTPRGPHNSAN